jgi:hypothetical protein
MGRCRSCGAEITWARTAANDRPMPLDAQPTPDGNVRLDGDVATVLGPLDVEALTDVQRAALRMPHHATCPNWRK